MKRLLLILLCASALCAQTSNFPAAVDSDANLKVAKNNIFSALNAAATATDNVLVVKSSTGFVVNMLASVDSEIVSISAVNGNLLTVERGFDGTVAAAHKQNAKIAALVDAWHFNALKAGLVATQTEVLKNLSSTVDVRADGAKCDGVTNDLTALSLAEARPNARMQIPMDGTCYTTAAGLSKYYFGGRLKLGDYLQANTYNYVRTLPSRPIWKIADGSLISIGVAADVATITTSAAHGRSPGDWISISGVIAANNLNGQHAIAQVTSPTTFTVSAAGVAPGSYANNAIAVQDRHNVYFGGDHSRIQSESMVIDGSVDLSGLTNTQYYTYELYPRTLSYDVRSGHSGTMAHVTATSAAGQPVLYVNDTTAFTTGQTVRIGSGTQEYAQIASIQPNVSLTMAANLQNTYGPGDGYGSPVTSSERTFMTPYYTNIVQRAEGDNIAFMTHIIHEHGWSKGSLHPADNGTVGIGGGGVSMTAHGAATALYEHQMTDNGYDTNAYAQLFDFNRTNVWANTTVNADSAAGSTTLNIASTANLTANKKVMLNPGGPRQEIAHIVSVGAGSVTLAFPLKYTHTAIQGDAVTTDFWFSWIGTAYRSFGTNESDAAVVIAGPWKVGLDFSRMSSSKGAAIQLPHDLGIYYDSSSVGQYGDPLLTWGNVAGTTYTTYEKAASRWKVVVNSTDSLYVTSGYVASAPGINMISGGYVSVPSGSMMCLNDTTCSVGLYYDADTIRTVGKNFRPVLPTSCAGLTAGTLWNDTNTVKVCP